MPELMIDVVTSLDGHGAAEVWPGWWGGKGPSTSPQPEAGYTILMGANTYRLTSGLASEGEELLGYAPTVLAGSPRTGDAGG